MSEILKELKILLRITDNDEDIVLTRLIDRALEWVEVECNLDELDVDELPRGLGALLIDLVVYRYTVLGKEGITSEQIVELSYSYSADYPDYIKRRLKRFRKLRVY